MAAIDITKTVGNLVAEQPGRSRVFEWFGIDYCCGGKKPLSEACQEKGLDPAGVSEELIRNDADSGRADTTDWSQASVSQLIENILNEHHAYLQLELPRLTQLVNKVATVHGENHPNMRRVAEVYGGLRRALEAHMKEEEEALFPALRLMTRGSFGMLADDTADLIAKMEVEHQEVGDALARINTLTGGYKMPPDGCETFRATLHALMTLETDTHTHVHKENNILFPKALGKAAGAAA